MKVPFPYANGPWTVEDARVAFENPWIRITDHKVRRPDGSPGEYGVVHFKNRAVGVLPIDGRGRVPLVGQHRFPFDAYSWELPEGGGPPDEDPLATAKRELAEETGFIAASWFDLAAFDISNSVTDERAICFLAADLSPGPAAPDPTEILDHRTMSFGELHDCVIGGEIRDSLTVVMVLTAKEKALRGAFPAPICRVILETIG